MTTSAAPISAPHSRSTERADEIGSVLVFVGSMVAVAALVAVGIASLGAGAPFVLALAPAFLALVVARSEGRYAVRRLLHTLTVRPARARWYLVLTIPALGTLATVAIAVALGAPLENTLERSLIALAFLPLVVAIPAFAEEFAWRGFVVPRLLPVMSPLVASLLIAIPWSLVHLPLALPGQMYDGIAVWPSVVTVFSLSVLGTWIFVGTGGSVLMAGLFHALYNATTPITWGLEPDTAWVLRPLVFAGIAVAVVALGGFRRPTSTEGIAS